MLLIWIPCNQTNNPLHRLDIITHPKPCSWHGCVQPHCLKWITLITPMSCQQIPNYCRFPVTTAEIIYKVLCKFVTYSTTYDVSLFYGKLLNLVRFAAEIVEGMFSNLKKIEIVNSIQSKKGRIVRWRHWTLLLVTIRPARRRVSDSVCLWSK